MSNLDKKLPKDEEELKRIAESTKNHQMKMAIDKRLEILKKPVDK